MSLDLSDDDKSPLARKRLRPWPDRRIDQRDREPPISDSSRDITGEHFQQRALYSLFAQVKYWSSARGPRVDGQRLDDLQRAAVLMREAFAATWRAGYKGEDLADALLRLLRVPVPGHERAKICPNCGGPWNPKHA